MTTGLLRGPPTGAKVPENHGGEAEVRQHRQLLHHVRQPQERLPTQDPEDRKHQATWNVKNHQGQCDQMLE